MGDDKKVCRFSNQRLHTKWLQPQPVGGDDCSSAVLILDGGVRKNSGAGICQKVALILVVAGPHGMDPLANVGKSRCNSTWASPTKY